mmetsp:Transcript_6325/g.5897  ORF Transcript_6325/g.5897 Transcript_6325/m.5897 type:complete len:86 (+) Transcript_6325:959-1216(+)
MIFANTGIVILFQLFGSYLRSVTLYKETKSYLLNIPTSPGSSDDKAHKFKNQGIQTDPVIQEVLPGRIANESPQTEENLETEKRK